MSKDKEIFYNYLDVEAIICDETEEKILKEINNDLNNVLVERLKTYCRILEKCFNNAVSIFSSLGGCDCCGCKYSHTDLCEICGDKEKMKKYIVDKTLNEINY